MVQKVIRLIELYQAGAVKFSHTFCIGYSRRKSEKILVHHFESMLKITFNGKIKGWRMFVRENFSEFSTYLSCPTVCIAKIFLNTLHCVE